MRKQLPQNITSSVVTNVEKNDVVMGKKMALTLFGEMGVWEEFKWNGYLEANLKKEKVVTPHLGPQGRKQNSGTCAYMFLCLCSCEEDK